jgi:hypothetical protein
MDKKRVALELKKSGIQTILTKPVNLSIDKINKYLELKSKGGNLIRRLSFMYLDKQNEHKEKYYFQ